VFVKKSGALFSDQTFTGSLPTTITSSAPLGYQITDSYNHTDWFTSRESGVFQGDIGEKFFSQKAAVTVVYPQTQFVSGEEFPPDYIYGFPAIRRADYVGPLLAVDPRACPIPVFPSSNLRALGSVAIARCKPTNSVANLANFMAELYSEGLPKLFGATLWKENVNVARSSGEEYLNQEFGWKPMVSDVRDIISAVTHAQDVLDAYERGSNQLVRRRYTFPVEQTESTTDIGSGQGAIQILGHCDPLVDLTKVQRVLKVRRTWRQVWFSGAFTYHLPSDYRSRNALMSAGAKARTLLGLDLTPEVLWNAAPWSWAIDWFSNAGDVISNASDWSTDGLVLKYGYVMEHSFVSETYLLTLPSAFKQMSAFASPVTAWMETKRREKASPFGFDVDWSGFTPRQLAITVALGLTRS
jgi:hypothetical protein